jgi:hypothetical protein
MVKLHLQLSFLLQEGGHIHSELLEAESHPLQTLKVLTPYSLP